MILSPPSRAGMATGTSAGTVANAFNLNFEVTNNGIQHRAVVEDYENRLSSHDDHLKSAMNALNEKLKFYENIEMEKSHVVE